MGPRSPRYGKHASLAVLGAMVGPPTNSLGGGMDVYSFLETTAEISIAFAGFISIFFVLARRDGPLAAEIAVLVRFILLGGLVGLFLAALPLILSALGVAESALWRAASGVVLTSSVGMGAFAARQRRGLRDRDVTAFVRLAWLLATLSSLASLANILGWPMPPNGGIYLASIWLQLAITSVNLVDLVFRGALNEPAA